MVLEQLTVGAWLPHDVVAACRSSLAHRAVAATPTHSAPPLPLPLTLHPFTPHSSPVTLSPLTPSSLTLHPFTLFTPSPLTAHPFIAHCSPLRRSPLTAHPFRSEWSATAGGSGTPGLRTKRMCSPVLTYSMVLRLPYAQPGTDPGYCAIRFDRDLSLAGAVIVEKEGGGFERRLVRYHPTPNATVGSYSRSIL
eukprot:3941787-Rhodomonas_salina.3